MAACQPDPACTPRKIPDLFLFPHGVGMLEAVVPFDVDGLLNVVVSSVPVFACPTRTVSSTGPKQMSDSVSEEDNSCNVHIV